MLPLSRQNAYRARYQQLRPGWQTSGAVLEALARQRITLQTQVLDVGCGRGGVLELLGAEARLAVGLDPDWHSLREHRAQLPLVCGLGETLPFVAQTFDLVLGLWVLEHLAQPERVARELARVLRPGGRFLFITPNAHHPLIVFNRFNWAFPAVQRLLIPKLYGRAESDTFRVRYRANTRAQLKALATAHGFRLTSLRAIPDPTYLAFNDLFFRLSVLLEDSLPAEWGVHWVGEWERKG